MAEIIEGASDERIKKKMRARLVSPRFEEIEHARREIYESLAKLRELTDKERADQLQKRIAKAQQDGDEDQAIRLAQEKLQRKRASEADLGSATER